MNSHNGVTGIDCINCDDSFHPPLSFQDKDLHMSHLYEAIGENVGGEDINWTDVKENIMSTFKSKEEDIDEMDRFAWERDFCSCKCYMTWAEKNITELEEAAIKRSEVVEKQIEELQSRRVSIKEAEDGANSYRRLYEYQSKEVEKWTTNPYAMLWRRGFIKRYYNRLVHPSNDSHFGDFTVKMFLLFGSFYFILRIVQWSL
jgi:hypothetical protein